MALRLAINYDMQSDSARANAIADSYFVSMSRLEQISPNVGRMTQEFVL